MKQITEDYCSFEIAKLLKEKGFDGEVYPNIDIHKNNPTLLYYKER